MLRRLPGAVSRTTPDTAPVPTAAVGTGGTDTAAMMARAKKAAQLAAFEEATDWPSGIGTHGLIGRAGPGFRGRGPRHVFPNAPGVL